jgi:hypothetical protein
MKLKDLKKDESIGQVLLQRLFVQRLFVFYFGFRWKRE